MAKLSEPLYKLLFLCIPFSTKSIEFLDRILLSSEYGGYLYLNYRFINIQNVFNRNFHDKNALKIWKKYYEVISKTKTLSLPQMEFFFGELTIFGVNFW